MIGFRDIYGFGLGMDGYRCSGRWVSSVYSLEISRFCRMLSGTALGRFFFWRKLSCSLVHERLTDCCMTIIIRHAPNLNARIRLSNGIID